MVDGSDLVQLGEVFPEFLFDEAQWAIAVALMPCLANAEESPIESSASKEILAAAARASRGIGLGCTELFGLPKGSPRLAAGVCTCRLRSAGVEESRTAA